MPKSRAFRRRVCRSDRLTLVQPQARRDGMRLGVRTDFAAQAAKPIAFCRRPMPATRFRTAQAHWKVLNLHFPVRRAERENPHPQTDPIGPFLEGLKALGYAEGK